MPVPFFDLTRQWSALGPQITAAMKDVLDSQRFIMGPAVADLEAQMGRFLESPHVMGCASGTDALLLPLLALSPSSGDEVIVPAFTFFATAGAAWNAGFKPVFCDVEEDTFNVSARTLEASIGPRTRAIVVVHLFGRMAPMEEIMALAREHDLIVIEDVAQSIGAWQCHDGERRMAGTIGDIGAFSFFPTKNLGAFGDGGLITARDEDTARAIRMLRTHGGERMYRHDMVGTNSRLDSIQAAILNAKLPFLPEHITRRRANASAYRERLADIEEIALPDEIEGSFHTYNQFTVRSSDRDALRAHLNASRIGSKIYYPEPLHLQPCFESLGYRRGQLPTSESLCRSVLSLPVFPELTIDEVAEVSSAIRDHYA